MDAGSFIKLCRQEFDRLMETSPSIPDVIVNEFINKFKGKTEEEQNNFKNLKKPDICDTITSVNETRHKWFLNDDIESNSDISSQDTNNNDFEKDNKLSLTKIPLNILKKIKESGNSMFS
jgi:hypothetical protein